MASAEVEGARAVTWFDTLIMGGVVAGVLLVHHRVDQYIPRNYDPTTAMRPDTPATVAVRTLYNVVWLTLSPLGYFSLRFAQSLRADIARWRGRSG